METKLKPRQSDDPQFRNALSPGMEKRHINNDAWIALHSEQVLEPEMPIIDAHHHLYKRPGFDYFFDEYLADISTGHNIRGTVYVDCGTMYRTTGPEHMRVVGEVEFVNKFSEKSATGGYGPVQICAAIISSADVTLGSRVAEVLDAQISASLYYRGIRVTTKWDPNAVLNTGRFLVPPGLMKDSDFRAGFAELRPRKLSFDAMVFFHQLLELADLARAFPETTIVLNHIGGLVANSQPYLAQRDEAIALWKMGIAELGKCENVFVKLGGLGMPYLGYGFDLLDRPAHSETLAAAWGPYFHFCIDAFGPDRCMFESNYPPDKQTANYPTLWNAFKRVTHGYSSAERHSLFFSSAAKAYRLSI